VHNTFFFSEMQVFFLLEMRVCEQADGHVDLVDVLLEMQVATVSTCYMKTEVPFHMPSL
jgi:hypothetical protein